MMKKEVVHGVHETDLEQFLQSLGVLDKILEGRMSCVFCGRTVTLQNFQSVFSRDGEIQISCSARECFEMAIAEAEEGDED